MTEKKQYEAPQMQADEVKQSEIIATSGLASTESLSEEDFNW